MDFFKDFKDGIRVVSLINRGNQNTNRNSKIWVNKIITSNKEEFDEAVNFLKIIKKENKNLDLRIYSSVNSRNIKKAIKLFCHKQLDLIESNYEIFYKMINDSFVSCLSKPENRETKYFMIDYDDKNEKKLFSFLSNQNISKKLIYETKKGYHCITLPFDSRLINKLENATLHKDGLLLIDY